MKVIFETIKHYKKTKETINCGAKNG